MLDPYPYRHTAPAPGAPSGRPYRWVGLTLQAAAFAALGYLLPQLTGVARVPAAPQVVRCPEHRAKPWVVWLVVPRTNTPRCAPPIESPVLWSALPVGATLLRK